ncbi:MAG: hypothetical protein Kow0090_03380 [Myxococcota bacterium]
MKKSLISLAPVLFFLTADGILFAAPPISLEKTSDAPPSLPHSKPRFKYLDSRYYAESYSFVGDLDDGGFFQAQFAVTNIGFASHKGSMRAVYVDKEGVHRQEVVKFEREEQIEIEDGFRFGQSSLTFKENEYRVRIEGESFKGEVSYAPQTSSFRPGNGRVYYDGKKGFYDITVLFLKARFQGEIQVEGKKINLSGFAAGLDTYGTHPPNKQAKRWFRYFKVSGEPASLFTVWHPEEGGVIGWFVVSENGKLAEYSVKPHFYISGEAKAPKSEFGYAVPERFKLKLEDNEEIEVFGNYSGTVFRQDVFSDLGGVLSFIAKRFIQPESYTLRYNGEIKYKGKLYSAPALVEITFLSK